MYLNRLKRLLLVTFVGIAVYLYTLRNHNVSLKILGIPPINFLEDSKCYAFFDSLGDDWNNDFRSVRFDEFIVRLRVYEACTRTVQALGKNDSSLTDIKRLDQRMFPYLVLSHGPSFIGEVSHSSHGKDSTQPASKGDTIGYAYDDQRNWFYNWNSIARGRGIVLSIGDPHLHLAIRMLAVLKHQGNKLPIQFVHKGDLSSTTIESIKSAAAHNQEVLFVDVSPMIKPEYLQEFTGYKNKWLAVIFNTFEEFVFIDADAISILDVEQYFNLPGYKKTGALYFRDRSFQDLNSGDCSELFSTFGITAAEHHILDNAVAVSFTEEGKKSMENTVKHRFFKERELHHMDSGLVVINKKMNLPALITGMMLNMIPRTERCSLGDKEFFWLGSLVSGHKYKFYPVEASALGKHVVEKGVAKVCSIQLGHTSVDGKLLWLNGGFKRCKFVDAAEADWNSYPGEDLRSNFDNPEKVSEYYNQGAEIDAAVIPDASKVPWAGGSGSRCFGYTYCASKQGTAGKLVEFDEEHTKEISTIKDIWLNASDGVTNYSN